MIIVLYLDRFKNDFFDIFIRSSAGAGKQR